MSVKSAVSGTGRYVPDRILTNFDLEKIVDTSDEWISKRTGIKRRHLVTEEDTNSSMAAEASEKAIADAGLDRQEISAIVLATVTPDFIYPATAQLVQHELGIEDCFSFDLNSACSGYMYALKTADNLVRSGDHEHVLVVGSEVMTSITNWEDRNTCVLFGDAAAACILSAENGGGYGFGEFVAGSNAELADLLYQPAGGSRRPASHETVDNNEHTVHMKGSEVFKHAVRKTKEVLAEVLERNGREPEDIRWYISHQANERIIRSTCERFNVPDEKIYINIDEYGNTTAASIPLCIDELNQDGKLDPGDELVLFSFGAGFSWAGGHLVWGREGDQV